MINKKYLLVLTCLFLFCATFLPAQTAAELETVLMTPAVTCAQAARFVISSVNPEFEGDSFSFAVSRGWIKNSEPDEKITLGKLSLLIMKAFDMKGGMMYSIFPIPRYAYRSMVSRFIIQGGSDPAMTVNGDRFLLILGKTLSATGD